MSLTGFTKDSTTRNWSRPVGETGDLADIIVAVLSLASTEHEISKIRLSDFYQAFSQLQSEFKDLIPNFYINHIGSYPYSKTLGEAVENALRLGVQVANPRFQYLEVPKPTAKRILDNVMKRATAKFVEDLRPVASRLAKSIKDTTPQPCET